MYEYQKRKSKFKSVLIIILLMVIVSFSSIFIYSMYSNIEIYNSEETNKAVRLSYEEKNEEKVKTKRIEEIIEETVSSVVGISKIKNTGNSIFLNNSTENLGLGSGTIISENGYIITNWHVAGNKYSSCYITLENGSVYNRKCCLG